MDDLKVALEEVGTELGLESLGPSTLTPAVKSRRISVAVVASFIFIAITAVGLYMVSRITQHLAPSSGSPVVILMDTAAPMGVYDPRTRNDSGTNADDINNILRDLPVVLHKETVGAVWNREDQLLKQSPELIVIHRSAFFHSMNLEFQFGYPPFRESEEVLMPTGRRVAREDLFQRLYALAADKLALFLGYVGEFSPRTRILAYSRGDPGGWSEEVFRRDWVTNIEQRFPSLKGRVFTFSVEGGMEKASFRDPKTAELLKREVQSILAMNSPGIASTTAKH